MTASKRVGLSASQRVEVWRRWKAGESRCMRLDVRLARTMSIVHSLLKHYGGIAPPVRRRRPTALKLQEQEEISRGIASGCSLRGIAQSLRRAVSTVSREVARHGGRSQYRASAADQQAWESALRPKSCLPGHLTPRFGRPWPVN